MGEWQPSAHRQQGPPAGVQPLAVAATSQHQQAVTVVVLYSSTTSDCTATKICSHIHSRRTDRVHRERGEEGHFAAAGE